MSHSIPRSLVAATTLTAALTLSAIASAGTLQVRDDADVLTPAQETQLRGRGAQYPFDARVLTDARFTSRADFDRHVASQLAGPGMVVIGVDPIHRWSSVHFGTATRIGTANFSAIENAGDAYFRGSRWDEGFGAILGAAQQSVGTAATSEVGARGERSSFPWRTVIFGLLIVGGVALAFRAFRSRSQQTPGVGGWNGPNAPPQNYNQPPFGGPPGPGYGGYGPAPGSGMGTGIAGAALGGLAGYALGNAMANRGEEGSHGAAGSEGTNNTWDAGGSSSGWDGGGGGGDAGGGGDTGGGGDGGGGGGGGDW